MRIVLFCLIASFAFGFGCGARNGSGNSDRAGTNRNAGDMAANHGGMNHGEMDHSTMQSSGNSATAPYDLQFLDTMTAHHQAAIDMARTIDGKAQHAELNSLAKKIVADQEKEIAQMKIWRDEWFAGAAPALNMEMAGMGDSMKAMDMKRFETLSGTELDVEFIKQMIPHHLGAAAMAAEARRKSQRDEIKTLAARIIKEQNAEVSQMRSWLDAWGK